MPDHKTIEGQNLLPVPEVSEEKKYFSDASLTLGEYSQNVDDIIYKIGLEKNSSNSSHEAKAILDGDLSKAYTAFYSFAKELMRNLKPHLFLEDRKRFDENWKKLKDRLNKELYDDGDSVDELSEFLQQALKNANLSELGVKSRLEEIENEIDIGGI